MLSGYLSFSSRYCRIIGVGAAAISAMVGVCTVKRPPVLASPPMLREAFQDLNRLRQIAAAVVRHGFGAYLARSRLADQIGGTPAVAGAPANGERSTAARFREL